MNGIAAPSDAMCVLVVEDDEIMRLSLEDRLRMERIAAVSAGTLAEARHCLCRGRVDLVVSDIRLPDGTGRDLFHELSASHPGLPVILMTAYGSIPDAVDLVKAGAYDYLTKPFKVDHFVETVRGILAGLQGERHAAALLAPDGTCFAAGSGLLGPSTAMRQVEHLISRVAPLDSSVLITGESGVGKEVVANMIHHNSRRAHAPFVKVNCAAIPLNLVESELFGHEKGAFTGADRRRIGRFEQAQGGTIFLDEIAEIPPEVQVKLLRVLQERMIERVGGNQAIALDVRVLAATQVDLQEAIEHGRFRADLFWRLNVIRIGVAPLRERRDDVLYLARQFVAVHAAAMDKRVRGLSPDAERHLLTLPYPGNVRELKNMLERATALCDGGRIELHDLAPLDGAAAAFPGGTPAAVSLRAAVEEAEQESIRRALESCDWAIAQAADRLGISRKSLWEKMRRYGIER